MADEARPKILVIDDDYNIRNFLKRALTYSGYQVELAEDGPSGLDQLLYYSPELIILDILLPGMDGFEVCRRLRETEDVPVLMLTARDAVEHRVQGLDCGADDYLVKPFALEELRARVRALLRRQKPAEQGLLRYADVAVDEATHEVRRGNRLIELTAKEFELLTMFMRHSSRVLTREQLLEHVWGFDSEAQTHVLEVYVGYLRQKLEAGGEDRLIQTVRGVGYMLRG
ncbi:MAG: response regulator transcription factor [Chloroflexota bacterium]|nr:MAG: response regulator transcription factor [Chloroflexota bacterium]